MVLVVTSILIAIGLGSLGRYNDQLSLQGATQNIASRLLLTRERAMATRGSQTMQFAAATQGYDYRVTVGGTTRTGWNLPRRIKYAWLAGTINSATFNPEGECSTSGLIILKEPGGTCDTVCVLSSGLVFSQ